MGDHKVEIKYDNEAQKSPVGQVFSRLHSPNSEAVIHCTMGLRDPIDVESLKKAISNSIMMKHPRFCSIWVRDNRGSKEHWKRTHVNIDDHIIVHQHETTTIEDEDNKEAAINSFLAEISVSTPLKENRPLWEIHVLIDLNCVVLRVHHSVGDAVSLMSMLSACFGKTQTTITGVVVDNNNNNNNNNNMKLRFKRVWFASVLSLKVLGRVLWVKDKVSLLSGGDGVELLPRKIVTANFLLEDFNSIKLAVPKATVNDVLLGIISSGFSKYLNIKSSNDLQQAVQFTAMIPVNLRKDFFLHNISDLMMSGSKSEFSGWGNKTTVVFLTIHRRNGLHPLEHVKAIKAVMDKKKKFSEAQIIGRLGNRTVSYFGLKVGCWICRRIEDHTTLLISNIRGPSEELVIADNPVTYIKVNVSSSSQAIIMHMVSYAGQVNLQVVVAKDIIPDSELLVKCFHDSFLEMKNFISTV